MSTSQDIEPFKGGSWEECSAFIQRIRTAAWKEGKCRDPGWMADFASLHLSGDALTWFLHLWPEVQGDWTKLQAALVGQWSPLGKDVCFDPPSVSIAAATPSNNRNEKRDYLEHGILKAEVEGREGSLYVGMEPGSGFCTFTSDVGKALRFRFESQSSSTLLECVNRRLHSWLAIHWTVANPDLGRGSKSIAYLTTVDSETLKALTGVNGPFQLAVCRVASNGEATFIWRNGNSETSLTVLTNESSRRLYPVADCEAFIKENDKRVIAYPKGWLIGPGEWPSGFVWNVPVPSTFLTWL